MKEYTLHREQLIEHDLAVVFAFFADARNLEHLTPPWLRFEIVSALPFEMAVGTRIDYRLLVHGIPVRWQSEITEWEPMTRFTDEQVKGPYRRWIHVHEFETVDGGTLVRDHVRYAVPGGSLVERFIVRPDLERIWGFREKQLERLFTSEPVTL
jgi:ligand-binding SRPBCC domain-containing protein